MDELSKHLDPVDKNRRKYQAPLHQEWAFNPSMDDTYRERKKVDAKKEAILLASKVNRKAVNELVLSHRDDFEPTPKYLSVTRRLYNPFPDTMTGVASTEDDSAPRDYDDQSESDIQRHSFIANRHRAVTIGQFRADRNGLNKVFYNTLCTPSKNGHLH